jgi:hypothetical protein
VLRTNRDVAVGVLHQPGCPWCFAPTATVAGISSVMAVGHREICNHRVGQKRTFQESRLNVAIGLQAGKLN